MGNVINTPDSSLFADTGEWKSVISITNRSLKAILLSLVNPKSEPVVLASRSWNVRKEEDILRNIEDTIYENPRILEDFATRIIIDTDKVLWVPIDTTDEDDPTPEFYTEIYPCASEDIFIEYDGDRGCMFSLVPGLKSFLERTLPGCRVNCSANIILNIINKQIEERLPASSVKDYIGAAAVGDTIHTYAFRNGEFIGGAPHPFSAPTDIAYYILLLSKAYGFMPDSSRIILSANPEAANEAGLILGSLGNHAEIVSPLQSFIV